MGYLMDIKYLEPDLDPVKTSRYDQSPVFKSRVYKLVGYVLFEISNNKKV
jgi:hypothetical protein